MHCMRYDGTSGAFVGVFASGGGLGASQGVLFGPDGNLYAAAQTNNKIVRYNGTTGALIGDFATTGGLTTPTYMTFLPEPGTLTLLSLGGTLLIYCCRHDG